MKFSEQWLREWVNPSLTTAQLAEQLTLSGLEVEAIEPVAAAFDHVVVGEVLTVGPHPNAEKLQICTVSVGQTAPLQIVCGATNVRVGMKAPVALIGAGLPGGLTIKASKLRGIESFGMLCSAKELGMDEEGVGLLELPGDCRPGAPVREVLMLDDMSITLGLTPNRGDCLGIVGIARELAALNQLTLSAPDIPSVAAAHEQVIEVNVHAHAACPNYCGRVIRGVDPHATTPLWLRERLRRSGLRSISPIVDVTNYVLLEWGQPMHAFDMAKLEGAIHVREAKSGERLALLNGETIVLTPNVLVIADDKQAIALAGIMGGAATAVDEQSRDIFLESAFFAPLALAGKARQFGLHTDSSHRFERGVAPDGQRQVLERATALILQIAGGQPGPIVECCATPHLPKRLAILLRPERIERVLGFTMGAHEIEGILSRLNMQVSASDSGWRVIPPPYRFDITLEEDLIEELVRIKGYGNIPADRYESSQQLVALPESRRSRRTIKRQLTALGYREVITYSFIDPKLQQLIDPETPAARLSNPISSDMAVMRTSLWPGLLQTLQYNLNRQQSRLMLFECGLRFLAQPPDFNQVMVLAGLVTGRAAPKQWGVTEDRPFDFYDVKGHLEALLLPVIARTELVWQSGQHPALHPGKNARISRYNRDIGWIGALHPQVMKTLEIDQDVILFEIELETLQAMSLPVYQEVSKFPSIRRDIAVVIDRTISAQQLQKCVIQAAPRYLKDIELFDVYTGEGIDSGRKSVAMGLTLQDLSRTLTDSEVEDVMQRIIGQLKTELGASLRQ